MQPHELTLTEAADAIRTDSLSSEELMRACLARIAKREPHIKAWSSINSEGALAAAREADKVQLLGDGPLKPLHGIPVGVKDVIHTVDLPTEYNSVLYKGFRSGQDAAVVAILRASGAIILGKTETQEFAALGRNPVTRNPRDLSRTPGGSSSGSAAAVADNMVPLTLGTQTGGSLIRPASFCGVFGMKPTYGTISTEGAKLFSVSLDTIGWYARSLDDLIRIVAVLEISSVPAPSTPPLNELKLACCRTPYWDQASPDMQEAFENGIVRLRNAGISVSDLELGEQFATANAIKNQIMGQEGRVAFLNLYCSSPDSLSPAIRARMGRMDDRLLVNALDEAALMRMAFDKMAAPFHAVLTPASTGAAPLGISYSGDSIFNGLWTMLHVPCVSLPVLTSAEGMPIGLQAVGPRFSDGRLLTALMPVLEVLNRVSG